MWKIRTQRRYRASHRLHAAGGRSFTRILFDEGVTQRPRRCIVSKKLLATIGLAVALAVPSGIALAEDDTATTAATTVDRPIQDQARTRDQVRDPDVCGATAVGTGAMNRTQAAAGSQDPARIQNRIQSRTEDGTGLGLHEQIRMRTQAHDQVAAGSQQQAQNREHAQTQARKS
jgi:hypothetical protein